MKQIPLKYLKDTASLYHVVSVDRYNKPTYGSAISLSRIYCEPTHTTIRNANGELQTDVLILFFDCVNSLPASTSFAKNDKIVYKEVDYIVRINEIIPNPVTGSAHHYEVRLIGNS